MDKIKFNLEKLVKVPVNDSGMITLEPSGCGCVRGIAYVASHDSVNWSFACKSFYMNKDVAADSYKAYHWVEEIKDDFLKDKILKLEHSLLNRLDTPEAIKKELIDFLVENGYVETPAGSNIKEYANV